MRVRGKEIYAENREVSKSALTSVPVSIVEREKIDGIYE